MQQQVLRLYSLLVGLFLFVNSAIITPQDGLVLQTKFNGQTVTGSISINNNGQDCAINSLTITGQNAGDFLLGDAPTLPHNLKAGDTITISVGFKPTSSAGPKQAALNVQSTCPGDFTVVLRGLAINGDDEGSLQWIVNTYGYSTVVGDDKPADSSINSVPAQQTAPLIGDEIACQQFVKSGQGNVHVQCLAVFGPTTGVDPVVKVGWYQNTVNSELFNVPPSDAKTVNPKLTAGAILDFDPGNSPFGFYSAWPFFNNRVIYQEDSLNTWTGAIPHNMRVYPAKDANGAVLPNTFIVTTEEYTGNFDFNDVVLLVTNVAVPGTTTSTSDTGIVTTTSSTTSGTATSESTVTSSSTSTTTSSTTTAEETTGAPATTWAQSTIGSTSSTSISSTSGLPQEPATTGTKNTNQSSTTGNQENNTGGKLTSSIVIAMTITFFMTLL